MSPSEYLEYLRIKGGRTHREVLLDALGIEYQSRKLGRPQNVSEVLDELFEIGEKTRDK